MGKWLFNILKDGTLKDNQIYFIQENVLRNTYNSNFDKIVLKNKDSYRTKPEHYECKIWEFLHEVARHTKQSPKNIVLFNDELYEHNTDDALIQLGGTDARNFTLTAGNLIGFVKQGEYSLKISSRFGDNFLRYLIADADGFLPVQNAGGEGESQDNSFEWLLAYLWQIKLKKAYRLGLPKTYIGKTEQLSRVRGSIDVIDYFQNRDLGKYRCSYREHSYKNLAVALFVKAYQETECFNFGNDTRQIYQALITATQGERTPLKELLNTPHFSNPFYSEYNILIDLSKRIIRQKGFELNEQNDSDAFLFDVSMLFEYFIRKLIERKHVVHILDKTREDYTIPTGRYQRKLEPDLVFEKKGGLYVFDVKYKSFDNIYGVKREDLFQLHTYIGQYGNHANIKGCGFIYPLSEERWEKFGFEQSKGIISNTIAQQGKDIPFHVLFLKIPKECDDYKEKMDASCEDFIEQFKTIL